MGTAICRWFTCRVGLKRNQWKHDFKNLPMWSSYVLHICGAYCSRRLLAEFLSKNQTKRGLDILLSHLQETRSTNCRHGIGRLKCVHTEENVTAMEELTHGQEGWHKQHARYWDRHVSLFLYSAYHILVWSVSRDDMICGCRTAMTSLHLTTKHEA